MIDGILLVIGAAVWLGIVVWCFMRIALRGPEAPKRPTPPFIRRSLENREDLRVRKPRPRDP